MKEIDLVLSGSGNRFPVYVGALRALLDNGYQIKRVAGASGGALVACALGMGIINGKDPAQEMLRKIAHNPQRKINFLERWRRNRRLIKGLGFFSGEKFENFLDAAFEGKTMQALEIPTRIYVTDVWNQKTVVFTNDTPLKISKVLRMTTGVPVLFTPVEYNGGLMVDGGISAAFPIDAFKDGIRPLVGMRLKDSYTPDKKPESLEKVSLLQYIRLVLLTIFVALQEEHMKQVSLATATIINLDTGKFSRFHPGASEKDRMDLYQSGYNQMQQRIREMN